VPWSWPSQRPRGEEAGSHVLGSTLAPEVTARDYSPRLSFAGDDFQIPTVGVAVDSTHIAPDDPAVLALVRANRRALRTIRDKPDLAARYVDLLIRSLSETEASRHSERLRRTVIHGRRPP
jgi:hypothetical protein